MSINRNKGFTLIEMAMVLMVIGLLIIGITQGSTLLNSSKRNKVITDLKEFKVAWEQFGLKYDAYPGDFISATSVWNGTQNGNGDGTINLGAPTYDEAYLAWQHFSLAELIKGTYIGTNSGVGVDALNHGVNIPATPYGGLSAYNILRSTAAASLDLLHIRAGANATATDTLLTTRIIPQDDTTLIDTKIDDDNIATGMMNGDCVSNVCAVMWFLQDVVK
jgi:prepilin-type N-terminal cleavage/methylation domain-containing protein